MKILGDSIELSVGPETVRGTPVAPVITVPGRAPVMLHPVLDKVLVRETRGSRMSSQASEIVQKRAEGTFEFNVRNNSIRHFLKSLLGKATENTVGGVTTSVYELLPHNPQHPTNTFYLHQPTGFPSYRYPFGFVSQIEFRTPVNELVNATATLMAANEVALEAPVSKPASGDAADDFYFRNWNVRIKLAESLGGLDAAQALKVKEFALTMNNSGRADQNIGDLTPSDFVALLLEATGSMTIDYEGATHRNIYADGAYRALRVEMERPDVSLGGGAHPKITIDLPRISYETLEPNRPIDEVVQDSISFNAHYDENSLDGLSVTVVSGEAGGDGESPES